MTIFHLLVLECLIIVDESQEAHSSHAIQKRNRPREKWDDRPLHWQPMGKSEVGCESIAVPLTSTIVYNMHDI